MSAISAAYPSAGALPVTDAATEPAAVRNGDQAAKNAYQTGLAFEQMLVSQLSQQMTATISGTGSSDDGLGGTPSGGSASGSGSADPAAGAYSSLLPSALTSGLMGAGSTGVAMQIAGGIDPALAADPDGVTTKGTAGTGTNDSGAGAGAGVGGASQVAAV